MKEHFHTTRLCDDPHFTAACAGFVTPIAISTINPVTSDPAGPIRVLLRKHRPSLLEACQDIR